MRGPTYSVVMVCAIAFALVACIGVNRPVNKINPPRVPGAVASIASTESASIARRQWEPGGRVYRVNQMTVVTPAACEDRRAINLVRNVRFILTAFEYDHGPIKTSYTIFITDQKTFPMQKDFPFIPIMPPGHPQPPRSGTIQIIGVYCGSAHEIAVVAGAFDCLPALYHEFCHGLLDVDCEHSDPRWKRFEQRGDKLSERLRRRWH